MMNNSHTYVYFAFKGQDFDPNDITKLLAIEPSSSRKRGDTWNNARVYQFSYRRLQINQEKEDYIIENSVDKIVSQLYHKIELINEIKIKFNAVTVLEIVLFVDTNPLISTPALGHTLRTVEFLYKTGTTTDVDIYTFSSEISDTEE